jgi:hypothetical protein
VNEQLGQLETNCSVSVSKPVDNSVLRKTIFETSNFADYLQKLPEENDENNFFEDQTPLLSVS